MNTSVWPVSVAGWISLAIAILGLLGVMYSYAKNLAHINGLGTRVAEVEKAQKANETREVEWIRALDCVTSAQEALLEKIGHADKGAMTCSEDMEKYAIDIGSKFDQLSKIVNEEGRKAGERLQAVETELRITREARSIEQRAGAERAAILASLQGHHTK